MRWLPKSRWVAGLLVAGAGLLGELPGRADASPLPQVAIVRTAAWSQGDQAHEGATEFLILLEVARLQQAGPRAGLVAIGDRRGLFSPGAEQALLEAVHQGVPVVKLAQGGRVLPGPHGLFLDGGELSPDEARQILARCLERHGPLPAAPARLKERLKAYQNEFTLAASTRLAAR